MNREKLIPKRLLEEYGDEKTGQILSRVGKTIDFMGKFKKELRPAIIETLAEILDISIQRHYDNKFAKELEKAYPRFHEIFML